MNAKIWLVLLALAAIFVPVFAADSACPDGTPNWACSTVNPGERCVNGAPTVTANPAPSPAGYGDKPYQFCRCENVAGWIYDATQESCIRTSCTDSGVTKNDGQCFTDSKPKYCSRGNVVSKASVCGCPAGKQPVGEECSAIPGWCATDADCIPTVVKECKNNACVDRQDCRNGKPSFCLSSEECTLTDTGYKCVAKPKSTASASDLPATPDSNYLNAAISSNNSPQPSDSGSGNAASPLAACPCCAPTAAMILIGVFAFSRKQE